MIDPFKDWQATFDKLDKTTTAVWAANQANWYAERIKSIEPDSTVLTPSGFVFVFDPAPMISALIGLTPGPTAIGAETLAKAWVAGISAVVYPLGIAVSSGTVYGSPSTPANTFSVIASVLINPASLLAGKAKIINTLSSAKPSAEANSSQFPKALNEATLQLKIDILGTNSAPTPTPLAAMGVPLL